MFKKMMRLCCALIPFVTVQAKADSNILSVLDSANGQDIIRSFSVTDLSVTELLVNSSGGLSQWSSDGFGNTAGRIALTVDGTNTFDAIRLFASGSPAALKAVGRGAIGGRAGEIVFTNNATLKASPGISIAPFLSIVSISGDSAPCEGICTGLPRASAMAGETNRVFFRNSASGVISISDAAIAQTWFDGIPQNDYFNSGYGPTNSYGDVPDEFRRNFYLHQLGATTLPQDYLTKAMPYEDMFYGIHLISNAGNVRMVKKISDDGYRAVGRDAGQVEFVNEGIITVSAQGLNGVMLESIGGAGEGTTKGGRGGTVTFKNSGDINVRGIGVRLVADGAPLTSFYNGAGVPVASIPGNGGRVQVELNAGSISTSGAQSYAMYAQANGARAGAKIKPPLTDAMSNFGLPFSKRYGTSDIYDPYRKGYPYNYFTLATIGGYSIESGSFNGLNYSGASGGDAGVVEVYMASGAIVQTTGDRAHALVLEAVGGAGQSATGSATAFTSGNGGDAGNGGTISVTKLAGTISTLGEGSSAVFAYSSSGGQAVIPDYLIEATATLPDVSKSSSVGKDVRLKIAGLMGQSGGDAGGSFGVFSHPNYPGKGGNGGAVSVVLDEGVSLTTIGTNSPALNLNSLGGQGGRGGNALGVSPTITIPNVGALNIGYVVGGDGGQGGSAGDVTLRAEQRAALKKASIDTYGANSTGIFAQSLGGSGGVGGDANLISVSVPIDNSKITSLNLSVTKGGSGGEGGHGGRVEIQNPASITTRGPDSSGVIATSIGGGGGAGGVADLLSFEVNTAKNNVNFASTVGGSGGKGAHGGVVEVINDGSIITANNNARGIVATSKGGGGGNGGDAVQNSLILNPLKASKDINISSVKGGNGAEGGHGGEVTVVNNGLIQTGTEFLGVRSHAIVATSVGGGGGHGGYAGSLSYNLMDLATAPIKGVVAPLKSMVDEIAADLKTFMPEADVTKVMGSVESSWKEFSKNVNTKGESSITYTETIGGNGGSGNYGGTVSITNRGRIITQNQNAVGIFAQSIGGGGGSSAVETQALGVKSKHSIKRKIGGNGGSGGHGGSVTVSNQGSISTIGDGSAAIYVQSIGGGGGVAGDKSLEPSSAIKQAEALNQSLKLAQGKLENFGEDAGEDALKSILGKERLAELKDAYAKLKATSENFRDDKAYTDYLTEVRRKSNEAIDQTLNDNGLGTTYSYDDPDGDWAVIDKGEEGSLTSVGGQSIFEEDEDWETVFKPEGAPDYDKLAEQQKLIQDRVDQYKAKLETHLEKLKLDYEQNVGGNGGAAGDGGAITITIDGSNQPGKSITTAGDLAPAIVAQSVGGGGGDGASAEVATAAGLSLSDLKKIVPYDINIKDSVQKIAKDVEDIMKRYVDPNNPTPLARQQAQNELTKYFTNRYKTAQKAVQGAVAKLYSVQGRVATGGDGGAGGAGGNITVTLTDTNLYSEGIKSNLVFLQSVGGGGGLSGTATNASSGLLLFNSSTNGTDGVEGRGGDIVANITGTSARQSELVTKGDHASALVMQSVGGGGGINYFVNYDQFENFEEQAPDEVSTYVKVKALQETHTDSNTGLAYFGILGDSTAFLFNDSQLARDILNPNLDLSASSTLLASDEDNTKSLAAISLSRSAPRTPLNDLAGPITAVLERVTVSTAGFDAPGIYASSIGGGGGRTIAPHGEDLVAVAIIEQADLINTDAIQSPGGMVKIELQDSDIRTTGDFSAGLLAQSIGGGGSFRGIYDGVIFAGKPADSVEYKRSKFTSGTSGVSGDVSLNLRNSTIRTMGKMSHGVMALAGGGHLDHLMLRDGEHVFFKDAESIRSGTAKKVQLTLTNSAVTTSGERSVALLAGTFGSQSTDHGTDIEIDNSVITGSNDARSAALGIVGNVEHLNINIKNGSTVKSANPASRGYALAVQSAANTNGQVSIINSTLEGNISMPSNVGMVFSDGATWNAGEFTHFGADGFDGVWQAPLTMLSFADDAVNTDTGQFAKTVQFGSVANAAASDVQLSMGQFREVGQVALLEGSTLNPGGRGQFMTSTVHMGSSVPMLWLASGSTLEMDIGHENGSLKHDQLIINPNRLGTGSIVSGGAFRGGYNLKIRLLGLREVSGKQFTLAEANSIMADGRLVQPLAVQGRKFKSKADGRERLVYQIDSVKFERAGMSSFASSIARQMDEQLRKGNYKLEPNMIAALGYYTGEEKTYEEQLAELAENGSVLDVVAQRIRALLRQNHLHSCLEFVGDGLGLVEQNCTYARVTGSDMRLSGSTGADSNQDVTGSQIALGGQRSIGNGLYAGVLFGLGQASADSHDAEYNASSQSVTLGAVIKKRFADKYEVAFSGTYSRGWSESNRLLNSTMASTAYLSGSTKSNEAGLRLRLSYYGTTDQAYIKPFVDFDARYYQSDAYSETGDSPFAMNYPGISFWTYTATPQLEVGTRINTSAGVWRVYASGGVALSNDDKQTMLADFVSTSGGAPIEMQFDATPTMGVVKAGVEYVGEDNSFASLAYEGLFGSGVRQQSLTARVGLRF